MMSEQRMESGMETAMMSVERQLPRKTRIMMAVRQAAMMASRTTPSDGAAHEDRLVRERIDAQLRRQLALDALQLFAHAGDDVQRGGGAGFQMFISTARLPSTRTMLVCGGLPSRTWATSRM